MKNISSAEKMRYAAQISDSEVKPNGVSNLTKSTKPKQERTQAGRDAAS